MATTAISITPELGANLAREFSLFETAIQAPDLNGHVAGTVAALQGGAAIAAALNAPPKVQGYISTGISVLSAFAFGLQLFQAFKPAAQVQTPAQ